MERRDEEESQDWESRISSRADLVRERARKGQALLQRIATALKRPVEDFYRMAERDQDERKQVDDDLV